MAVSSWNSALILGHSYVWRFDRFIRDEGLDTNLGLTNCEVKAYGQGGGKASKLSRICDRFLRVSDRKTFDAVCILVGDNDVKGPGPNDDEFELCGDIVRTIMEKAEEVKQTVGARGVIVCQLMPRFLDPFQPQRYDEKYNEMADTINSLLHVAIAGRRGYFFWRHPCKKCKQLGSFATRTESADENTSPQDFYLPDGVHLNARGNKMLYKSFQRMLRTLRM